MNVLDGFPVRPTLRGPRVVLRGPRPSDIADRLASGRHPDFARLVGETVGPEPFRREDAERWHAQIGAESHGWVIEVSGRAIGTARLHRLEETNRRARFAIGIFDSEWWGRGVGTEATRLVLRHAFEELRLHRVDLRVLTDNGRAIAAYEKCGFVREGIERETVRDRDGWRSDLIMSILEREYVPE